MTSFRNLFSRFSGYGLGDAKVIVKEVTATISVLVVTIKYVGFGSILVGPSMLPTFARKGDIVIYDAWSHQVMNKDYNVGDVVIATCPYDEKKLICKRVTAVANEDIILHPRSLFPSVVTIPQGHVWLAGDNPDNSTDSRRYGPVPIGLLKGRIMFKLQSRYPFYSIVGPKIEGTLTESTLETEGKCIPDEASIVHLKPVAAEVAELGELSRNIEEDCKSTNNNNSGTISNSSYQHVPETYEQRKNEACATRIE